MNKNIEILEYAIEAITLKNNLRFMEIVNYIRDNGVACKPQDVANILHNHCINHIRLSKEPYFYKIERGIYRMVTDEDSLDTNKSNIYTDYQEDFYELEDKRMKIANFTRLQLSNKGLILDHSDMTRIRFSSEKLDKIVGLVGEGWSKQIKRLLLFEIENRVDKYTLKLIIGPGDSEIRKKLHNKAKENTNLYNGVNRDLSDVYTTIYSQKILDEAQLRDLSIEQIEIMIENGLEIFIQNDLDMLCDELNLKSKIKQEQDKVKLIIKSLTCEEINETEKDTIIKVRIGHGELKKELLKKEKCCKICGLSDKRFLIASHIKPWCESNDKERLDLNNVLLLCPHHDSAFDKGYITFDDNGILLSSTELSFETKALLNLNINKKMNFVEEQKKYIRWHRANIFNS